MLQASGQEKPRKYGYFRWQAPPGIAYLLGGPRLGNNAGAGAMIQVNLSAYRGHARCSAGPYSGKP
jgi:hypothetical protein